MKLLILGSNAADRRGSDDPMSHDYRRNSSALINSDLLIDAGPEIFSFANDFGYGEGLFSNVSFILQTHSHGDHFSSETIRRLASVSKKKPVLFGHSAIAPLVPEVDFVPLNEGETFTAGGYTVTCVAANHETSVKNEKPLHYIICDGQKTVFYGLDGAWLMRNEITELSKHKLDLMIFDCTTESSTDWRLFEHNCIATVRLMAEYMRKNHILRENGIIAVNHLACSLHKSHAQTAESLEKDGITVCYDGLFFELK